jgi:hypothetical protein
MTLAKIEQAAESTAALPPINHIDKSGRVDSFADAARSAISGKRQE